MSKAKGRAMYISAKTGRIVSPKYAKGHKSTTIKHIVKKGR